jgi:FixJ family two-component response regulator
MPSGNTAPAADSAVALVVIADPALRRLVARLARGAGFGAVSVGDFAHARLLTRGAPVAAGVLIADLPLHDREIRDLIAALRLWHANTPTVLLTHDARVPSGFGASGLPPVHWLAKPFTIPDFIDSLASAMQTLQPALSRPRSGFRT